jgi:hypothetical protein
MRVGAEPEVARLFERAYAVVLAEHILAVAPDYGVR